MRARVWALGLLGLLVWGRGTARAEDKADLKQDVKEDRRAVQQHTGEVHKGVNDVGSDRAKLKHDEKMERREARKAKADKAGGNTDAAKAERKALRKEKRKEARDTAKYHKDNAGLHQGIKDKSHSQARLKRDKKALHKKGKKKA